MSLVAAIPAWLREQLCPVSTAGVLALLVTKLADLATTIAGLTLVTGLTEQNPVAATFVREFGIPGLVVSSAVGLAVVIVVVEKLSTHVARSDAYDLRPRTLYLLSYVPLSVVFAAASINNSLLLVRMSG